MDHQAQQLQFARHFVHSVTVRPFLDDLRQAKRLSDMLAQLPRIARVSRYEAANEATNEAA